MRDNRSTGLRLLLWFFPGAHSSFRPIQTALVIVDIIRLRHGLALLTLQVRYACATQVGGPHPPPAHRPVPRSGLPQAEWHQAQGWTAAHVHAGCAVPPRTATRAHVPVRARVSGMPRRAAVACARGACVRDTSRHDGCAGSAPQARARPQPEPCPRAATTATTARPRALLRRRAVPVARAWRP